MEWWLGISFDWFSYSLIRECDFFWSVVGFPVLYSSFSVVCPPDLGTGSHVRRVVRSVSTHDAVRSFWGELARLVDQSEASLHGWQHVKIQLPTCPDSSCVPAFCNLLLLPLILISFYFECLVFLWWVACCFCICIGDRGDRDML